MEGSEIPARGEIQRGETQRGVPSLLHLCSVEIVEMAKRMRAAEQSLEKSNHYLHERKLELQLELAEVSESLEHLHVARKQLEDATHAFVDEVDSSLDEPLGTQLLAQLEDAHPMMKRFRLVNDEVACER